MFIFHYKMQGNFTVEAEKAKYNFETQAVEKMASMLLVLPEMPTQFLRCDPPLHKAGETYLEVTNLLQVTMTRLTMIILCHVIAGLH